jgi:transcriptional regulator with XRE-family HTH domain
MNFKYEVIPEAMKIQGLTFPALAKLCGTPESTLKKLARGETEDPRISTLHSPFKVLGLSIDRACGLAPERDMEKEAAAHNVSMAKALQERLAMQDDKIATLSETVSEQKAVIAAKTATIEARDKSIAHRDEIIRSKDRVIRILVCILAFIVVMDLMFANHGWFSFGLFGG